MPAKNTTALTDTQKQTIVALRTQGISNRVIATKLGLHPITVSKAYGEFRREAAHVIDDIGHDWKRDMKILAVRSVKRSLTDESDTFRSGSIGVQALKGLGEFVTNQKQEVDTDVRIHVSWETDEPRTENPPIDVRTRLLSD